MQAYGQGDDDDRFVKACEEGDLETARRLVTPQRVSRADSIGSQPLHWACDNGHLEVARWLHAEGAAIDATTNYGETPLWLAQSGGHTAVVDWLQVRTPHFQ